MEDPRAEQADAAVAGLVERYYAQGAGVLRPFKLRFRKMLSDRDVGVRQVAAWALSRTGDLDVVPALVDAMVEPNQDEDVVAAIRLGSADLEPQDPGAGAAESLLSRTSASRRRSSGASGIRRSGRLIWRGKMTIPARPVRRSRRFRRRQVQGARPNDDDPGEDGRGRSDRVW